jgi:thiol-disulfide isomerase/thioredoxin
MKRRQSWAYFVGGLGAAGGSYGLNVLNPQSETQILSQLTLASPPISSIGATSKPTIVEFWAPWCENCKASAYKVKRLKDVYGGKVNVILVDGDDRKNGWLVDRFRVDAIPHVALINPSGTVETSLVGVVPEGVVIADVEALIARKDLPYVMYDPWKDLGGEGRNMKDLRDTEANG